jgi:hypothetical protein
MALEDDTINIRPGYLLEPNIEQIFAIYGYEVM